MKFFNAYSLGKVFVATMQTFSQTPLFRNTLVVWQKTRIMYLRLWAWLSLFAPFLWLAYASHTHIHINLPFLSPTRLSIVFWKIIAKTQRYELRLFFIQPNFCMHIHFCQSNKNIQVLRWIPFQQLLNFMKRCTFRWRWEKLTREEEEKKNERTKRNEKLVSKVILI